MTGLRINAERLQANFEALAQIGSTGDGGVSRPTFSAAHLAARRWFQELATLAGLEFHRDETGNHSAVLRCGDPGALTLLLGSHLDSVPRGGRFDGALGVVAALEVLQTVQEAGLRLPVHLEAIDFTDEEGTLFGLLGSSALAGKLTGEDLQAPRGGRDALLEGLARADLRETGLLLARREPESLAGYLELHIEQGPRLQRAGIDIGVVTAIAGIASYQLTFIGRANHAGTTPMNERLDAAQAAAAFILDAHQFTRAEFPECTVNIGQARLEPGAYNIVPGQAVLGLECRAPQAETFARLESALLEHAHAEADWYGLNLEVEFLGRHLPAGMSSAIQEVIVQAAGELGLRCTRLPSGAGHDAQMMTAICPTGMIFVPSKNGISHSSQEFTPWQDCLNGANLLLQAALQFTKTA